MPIQLSRRGIMAKQTPSGGGPWTPATISPWGWWKASSLGLADATAIDSWTDLSGNSRHLTAAGTARPTYKTAILNGKAVARFDGANNVMSLTGITPPGQGAGTDLSVFVVAKAGAGSQTLVSTRNAGSTGWIYRLTGTNTWIFAHPGATPNVTDSDVPDISQWVLYELVRTGLSAVVGHNGAMDAASVLSAAAVATTRLDVGMEATTTVDTPNANKLTGDIAEIIVTASAVGTSNRDSLETYVNTEYGITVV